jgi:hypothetical protein
MSDAYTKKQLDAYKEQAAKQKMRATRIPKKSVKQLQRIVKQAISTVYMIQHIELGSGKPYVPGPDDASKEQWLTLINELNKVLGADRIEP